MQESTAPAEPGRPGWADTTRSPGGTDTIRYDDAIQIATALFSTPIAFVCLIQGSLSWLAAKVGIVALGEEAGSAFNAHVVSTGSALIVEDAEVDVRFSNDPSVCGPMHLRFFAGVPLYALDTVVGTLCVVDTVPRIVDFRKLAALAALGRQLSDVLEQRARAASLTQKEQIMVAHVEEARTSNTLHRLAARRFETLFHGVPIACFTFDQKMVVHEWNREAERVFGRPAFDVLDDSLQRALSMGRRAKLAIDSIRQVLRGENVEDVEWAYRRPDGDARRLCTSAFPLRGPQGQIVGGVCATVDMTERREQERALKRANLQLAAANARLEKLASYDGLTGIPNYRAFIDRMDVEFANSARTGRPICLLLLDVDRFKALNDTHGHPAGDRVLQTLAELLAKVSRKGDFVARYGGEEFVMILPNTAPDVGGSIAERVRQSVAKFDWPYGPITISIGYATTQSSQVESVAELVTRADRALYQSKREGRDRVTFFQNAA